MSKDNKKFPVLAVVITLASLFLAVFCASTGLFMPAGRTAAVTPFALLEIAIAVLFLAGLTTNKGVLVKVVTIIVTVSLVVTSFVLVLVNLSVTNYPSMFKAVLFALSLLMFICSVLGLIYYFNLRNPRIRAMYKIASISFFVITVGYAIAYMVHDLMNNGANPDLHIYFLTFALATISILPVATLNAFDDEEEQPQE